MLYDSIYMVYPECRHRMSTGGWVGAGYESKWGLTANGGRVSFFLGGEENVLKSASDDDCTAF